MSQAFKNGYALLIGVDESSVPAWALPVVAKDIAALEKVLTHPERCAYPVENVKKISGPDATRTGILDGLAWLQDCIQKDASGNATAVLFYSGHGWCPEPPAPQEFFLIPYDIRSDFVKSSGLRAEDFAAAVDAIKPERLLVVLDSCHAAGMAVKEPALSSTHNLTTLPTGFIAGTMPISLLLEEEAASKRVKGIGVLSKGRGRAVLNSSTSDQLSYIRRDGTMSIFTYHLIEALSGHAQPQEGATEVLVSDVMGHVSRRVPESARNECGKKQEPEFQISGGNFPIAMLLGGKGLSKGQIAPDPLEPLAPEAGNTKIIGNRGVLTEGNAHNNTIITGNGNKVNQTRWEVNTGGGAHFEDSVNIKNGDFVGRDKTVLNVYSCFQARPDRLGRSFDTLMADKLQGFVGRQFVFEAITKFMRDKPRGYFFVRGDPGIGKSALAAHLVKQYKCVHHFNIRAEGINKTDQFLGNIYAQLIAAFKLDYPLLPLGATKDAGFLRKLLDEVSGKIPPDKKVMIVVDALDEVDEATEMNILCFPKTLPKGIYIIATMRRVYIPLLIECEQETLDIAHDSANNLGDVREHVSGWVEEDGIRAYITAQEIDTELFVENLVKQSEGNFMYLRYVLPEIEHGAYSDLSIENLPKGLECYYEDHWRRMGMMAKSLPRDKIRIVYILSEVRQPVSRTLIAQFADSSDMKVDELAVQDVLDKWDQFLHKHLTAEGTRYGVYHTSFREFLHRKDIVQAAGVTIQGIHALIADDLWVELFGEG